VLESLTLIFVPPLTDFSNELAIWSDGRQLEARLGRCGRVDVPGRLYRDIVVRNNRKDGRIRKLHGEEDALGPECDCELDGGGELFGGAGRQMQGPAAKRWR
jgi:hypothetical protein